VDRWTGGQGKTKAPRFFGGAFRFSEAETAGREFVEP
jgi:hypothetical protein